VPLTRRSVHDRRAVEARNDREGLEIESSVAHCGDRIAALSHNRLRSRFRHLEFQRLCSLCARTKRFKSRNRRHTVSRFGVILPIHYPGHIGNALAVPIVRGSIAALQRESPERNAWRALSSPSSLRVQSLCVIFRSHLRKFVLSPQRPPRGRRMAGVASVRSWSKPMPLMAMTPSASRRFGH
jgi:hypothetical protein